MIDGLKGFAGTLALVGILLTANPALADSVLPDAWPPGPYAMWAPSFCSTGGALWGIDDGSTSGGTHVYLDGLTYSLSAPGGACNTQSPASAGVFAAQPKVLKRYGSTWSICQNGPWASNAPGAYKVEAYDGDQILGCGAGQYRLLSTNRITYGGVNRYAPDDVAPFLAQPITIGVP